ncbi:Hsp70 family protein [Mycobacterium sp. IDR2000157661]|uniref:Hsp70 family protein n=1 Tax=Mycobacterium sp. IDR2000157661 TaxID=2867005 RepID=UPI001EEB457E|nr:Hsp70 family protein [Mycobacterium sp. IDR2000157661]ULE34348.1 Hsp70 family protein [Mycobacterium sp. IDR2000157661]
MSDSLGLSIGSTNLVAARVGRPPVMRRSILTVFDDRAPEVGVPSEFAGPSGPDPNHPGMVLSGFVERVGDPVPLVAADGSPHRGERVLVEALDAMARTVGGGAPIAIAVPAHWGTATVGALRGALRAAPGLAPNGTPPALVPDSAAALAALQAAPGLPRNGVVVLCDFGGSGTNITLADAGSNLDSIGETVRYADFSGDQIDQALLNHVLAGVAAANDADPAGTAAVSSLARLRNEARMAKERLSGETATVVHADLPGFNSDVRVTRTELEQLIGEPLTGVLDTVEETLQRNSIPLSRVSAVATVGGGANIPLVTQQLSTRLRAPVITTPQSQLNVAAGAALIADSGLAGDAPTGMAPTGLAAAADAPTGMAAAAWAAGAAGVAAAESASDGAASATFRALAWSQDDAPAADPVPYAGEDYTFDGGATGARPGMEFAHEEEGYEPEPAPLPWYRRPVVLFGAAAAAALLAVGGLAVTLTSTSGDSGPVTETATTVETGPSPGEPVTEPQTVTITGPDGSTSTSVVPPPPPSSTTTTTTTAATTTTTTTAATTTTTTAPTTTTTRPTTTTPPPTTTTQPPPTTTAPPTISTTPEVLIPDAPA